MTERETDIKKNIERIRSEIPAGVELVAVSKFHLAEAIMQAYEAGQRCFGESRVQELLEKKTILPADIKWHFIGHLQTNKVRQLVGLPSMIESVDSPRLLELIHKESEKKGIVTNLLLQVHVAKEETKFGFYPEELKTWMTTGEYMKFNSVRICGLMGMASNTPDMEVVRHDFRKIREIYDWIKSNVDISHFKHLSMGMSGDWPIAVEEGADIVRIGSAIFGDRQY